MGTKPEQPTDLDVSAWQSVKFFRGFRADELGSTKIVTPNPMLGFRGEEQKMLDLTKPDDEASPLIISVRSEYSTAQSTVSQGPSQEFPIIDATNAVPIVITTPAAHGLLTGAQITITGVNGNTAANGSFIITVTGANTFSLNGSAGNGAYLGGGQYTVLIGPVSGSGLDNLGSPCVGRILWGVGGGKNLLEFDIPSPRIPDFWPPVGLPGQWPVSDLGGGIQLYINASHVSLWVRNDANLSTLTGANIPNRVPGTVFPSKVIAFCAPGASRGGPPLQRTIVVAGGFPPAPLTPGSVVNVPIPPFAKRVRFERDPIATTPLRITFFNNVFVVLREVNIPVNAEGPINVSQAQAVTLNIQNQGADNITQMTCVFDVDPI